MSVKNMKTSITLTNNDDKKYLTFNSFSNNESKKSNIVEINNALDNPIVKNFLSTSLKSVRYVRSFIECDKYRECIEIRNSGDSSLIIISDNVNKYFNEVLNFINENRTKIYEKYLFDLICKHKFDELIFRLSPSQTNSEIKLENIDGKTKLIYYVPFKKDEKNKIIINSEDLELIQKTINSYLFLSSCNIKCPYDDGALGYLMRFVLYTDKADIIIDDRNICNGLELYLGVLKRDFEIEALKQRDEEFKKSQKNIIKRKLKVLKNDNNKE